MNRFRFTLLFILILATVASHAATGQTIPPPVHLPIVRYDETPSPTPSPTPPFIFQCANVTEIPQRECQALLALYNSANGPGWKSYGQTGWLTTNTPCRWYGVTCQDGHVSILHLANNYLVGTIPPELGNLANLQALNLSGSFRRPTDLSGAIPPELGNLANLQKLYLGVNDLSGAIPPELGKLANLHELDLAYNDLSGAIPPELGKLASLQKLYLGGNDLSGAIPPELGKLANLHELFLAYNDLSGAIPPELGNLANLNHLILTRNQLSGLIPPELSQLANLSHLILTGNQLSGLIPPELSQLANLQMLFLDSNQLSGLIPPQLANLSGLGGYRPPGLSLSYNTLMATDPALLAFLTEKAPEWDTTQTVAPTSVQASTVVSDTLEVTWTPIRYTGDDGYYEISYATDLAGPFTVHGVTLDKTSSQYTLTEQAPDTRYFVRVRTYTPAHENNQNELWSDYSSVAFVATHAVYLPIIAE